MKKWCLLSVFLVLIAFGAFCDNEEQEEIDFLLFFPNSSSRFVNEERARVQLDNLAKYLTGRTINPGQINVYGYTAFAANDIDPLNLSRDRALFVINQLQRRGVPRDLFSEPVGYGTVDLWGANTDEAGKSLNRRVRVLLDGTALIPEPSTGQVIDPPPPATPEPVEPAIEIPVAKKEPTGKSKGKSPWWILLPLLLLLLLILSRRKSKSSDKETKPKKIEQPKEAPVATPAAPVETRERVEPPAIPVATHERVEPPVVPVVQPVVPAAPPAAPATASQNVAPTVVPVVTRETVVYLEEEIRFRAYEYSLQRNGQDGNMDEDWYKGLIDVCAKYEADGYRTYKEDGCWWARKSFSV